MAGEAQSVKQPAKDAGKNDGTTCDCGCKQAPPSAEAAK